MVSAAATSVNQFQQDCAQHLDSVSKRAKTMHATSSSAVDSLLASHHEQNAAIGKYVEFTATQLQSQYQSIEDQLSSSAAKSQALNDMVDTTAGEVQQYQLLTDTPTGQTPRKRNIQVPAPGDWERTRAHEELRREFRVGSASTLVENDDVGGMVGGLSPEQTSPVSSNDENMVTHSGVVNRSDECPPTPVMSKLPKSRIMTRRQAAAFKIDAMDVDMDMS